MAHKKFKPGDRVSVIDEDLEGIVTGLSDKKVQIETTDGFLLQFREDELIKRARFDDLLEKVPVRKYTHKHAEGKTVKTQKPQVLIVDLHAHELFTSTAGMTKHAILTAQLDEARKKLEYAIRFKIPKVILIHGIGKGKLRDELYHVLKHYPVRMSEAPYHEYGQGAVEVKIFQNYKQL